MTKKTVSVSIVAANYNNGKYLSDFINSINDSTVLPKELIIVNDGSTDNSLEILDSFSNLNYLQIIDLKENVGFCNALNRGLDIATSKYILRADPDDIVTENRIETQYNYLEQSPQVDVVGSNAFYFNNTSHKEIFKTNFLKGHSAIKKRYLKGEHGVLHATTMIKNTVMKKYRYDQENVRAEDYEIFSKIIADGYTFANISTPLYGVRIHTDSASTNIEYSTIEKTFKIRDEIFNTSTSKIKTHFYFWYILNYRRFLISQNFLLKPMYLFLSVLFYPSKLIKRLL